MLETALYHPQFFLIATVDETMVLSDEPHQHSTQFALP